MGRAEFRKEQRDIQKLKKVVDKFSPNQMAAVEAISRSRAKDIADKYIDEIENIIGDCTYCVLVESGLDAEKITTKINKLMVKESLYADKEAIDLNRKITKQMIIDSAKKHGFTEEGRRKIAKELNTTYSNITTLISRWKIESAVNSADKQVSAVKSQNDKEDADPDVIDAMEKISEILGEGNEDKMNTQDIKKVLDEGDKMAADAENKSVKVESATTNEDEKNAAEIIEAAKEVQSKINFHKASRLKPVVMLGSYFKYNFSPEGVTISEGNAMRIEKECIEEQQEALKLWEESYR